MLVVNCIKSFFLSINCRSPLFKLFAVVLISCIAGSDKEGTVPVAPREKTGGRRAVAAKAVKYDMVRNFKSIFKPICTLSRTTPRQKMKS